MKGEKKARSRKQSTMEEPGIGVSNDTDRSGSGSMVSV